MAHAYFDESGNYITNTPRKPARKHFHIFEHNARTGNYDVQTYDPLASVIGYLRSERWNESQSTNDAARIFALVDAIELCVTVYNSER